MGRRRNPGDGTVEHPYSALNLRLVLAAFGLVTCAGLAVFAWVAGFAGAAVVLGAFAVVALVDLIVIQRRRRRRRHGERHSLFE
jgi:membrane protein implicated in regulation of membrane protease activity